MGYTYLIFSADRLHDNKFQNNYFIQNAYHEKKEK